MIKRIWFRPRVMKDVAQVDTSTSVMGIPMKMPLFICPTGLAKLIHPDGEKGLARAAKSTGIDRRRSRLRRVIRSKMSSPKPQATPSSSSCT